jgi:hypothetical protein
MLEGLVSWAPEGVALSMVVNRPVDCFDHEPVSGDVRFFVPVRANGTLKLMLHEGTSKTSTEHN